MQELSRREQRSRPEFSRPKVLSVTAGGAHHHCNNSWNVRIFTLGALLTHGQLYGIGSAVRQGNIHSL
jgi:hypothetical protein